jgi:hypothetical protein
MRSERAVDDGHVRIEHHDGDDLGRQLREELLDGARLLQIGRGSDAPHAGLQQTKPGLVGRRVVYHVQAVAKRTESFQKILDFVSGVVNRDEERIGLQVQTNLVRREISELQRHRRRGAVALSGSAFARDDRQSNRHVECVDERDDHRDHVQHQIDPDPALKDRQEHPHDERKRGDHDDRRRRELGLGLKPQYAHRHPSACGTTPGVRRA